MFLFFDGCSPSCLGVLPCVDHVDAIDLIAMLAVAGLCETVCVVASSMLQAEVCVELLDNCPAYLFIHYYLLPSAESQVAHVCVWYCCLL